MPPMPMLCAGVRLRAGESRAHYYVWNGTPNEFALNLQFSMRPGVPDAVFGWHSLEAPDSPVRRLSP